MLKYVFYVRNQLDMIKNGPNPTKLFYLYVNTDLSSFFGTGLPS